MVFKVPEKNRLKLDRDSQWYSEKSYGCNGSFLLNFNDKIKLYAIASDNDNWEHVSISIKNKKRCPKWPEMCFVKALFWDEEDTVVQYHPPKSEYVSHYDYCLHLWRPTNQIILLPDSWMVGPMAKG